MDAVADKIKMPRMYRDGESFYHDVQKLLEPYKEVVRLHQEDLLQYKPTQSPVEFLFVDAMKSWPLAKKIVTEFFPLLIPGKSIVVQQDFIFHNPIAATNHLLMWRLRHHFEWLHQIPRSGSVVFVCKKQISADELPDLGPESFTTEEIDQAYDYCRDCIPEEESRAHIEAAKLLLLIERGFFESALKQARRLAEKGTKFREHVLADALRLIDQAKVRMPRSNGLPNESESANQLGILTKITSLLTSS